MKPLSLTIFFPAHNEEENIAAIIEDALAAAQECPYVGEFEILVVDDGSSDRTREVVLNIAARDDRIRVVWHARNRGYGRALKTGLRAARMDYIFFTDADRQFDLTELPSLLAHAQHYDAVIGYRAPRRDPAMRLVNAWAWNRLNRLLFGLRVRDIDCAFKLLRRGDVSDMRLFSGGAMLSAELLIRLKRRGARIREVPVSHLPRTRGSATGAKPSVILRALREMASLYAGELGSATKMQALRFAGVGVVNTILDVVAYVALTRTVPLFAEHLVAAKFFSFLLGTVSSLMLNRRFTFGMRERLTLAEVARFYSVITVSLAVNVEGMNLLVSAGMYDLSALVLTTGGTFVAGFLLSKFWVFRSRPPLRLARQ